MERGTSVEPTAVLPVAASNQLVWHYLLFTILPHKDVNFISIKIYRSLKFQIINTQHLLSECIFFFNQVSSYIYFLYCKIIQIWFCCLVKHLTSIITRLLEHVMKSVTYLQRWGWRWWRWSNSPCGVPPPSPVRPRVSSATSVAPTAVQPVNVSSLYQWVSGWILDKNLKSNM